MPLCAPLSLASRVVASSESFVAASAKITNRYLPSQVGSVGKLKRVCMVKEPNVFARYVCLFTGLVCMFVELVCMFAKLVCMSGTKSCSGDEVRFLTKTFQYLTFNSIFQDL